MLERRLHLIPLTLLILFAMAPGAAAQEVFADWTSTTDIDFGAVTATASTSNSVNETGTMLSGTAAADGAANYPDAWFTPIPSMGILWSSGGVNNVDASSQGSVDVTVAFSRPVVDPHFHFLNLDNGVVDFGAVSVVRLSGNPEFEVTGAVANSTPNLALAGGCEDAMGGNPNGACGTVELTGTYTSVTFTVTDVDLSPGSGDGFLWTLSIDPALSSVTAIPTASQWGLILLAILMAAAAVTRLRA